MALVYRTSQTTPLTNQQVDDNFRFLKEEIDDKYNISDFTAAKISLKLNTPAYNSTTNTYQTASALAESNALNAWLLRGMQPVSTVPVSSNKESIVSRNINGEISATTVYGDLSGNATSATLAASATKLQTSRNINGIAFDGTSDVTIADNTKLPILGGTLTGKLNLVASISTQASVNIGIGAVAPNDISKVNGDIWATTAGIFYQLNGQTNQFAPVISPTFTGVPQAPGFTGVSSQIVTLSHLDNAVSTLNTSISTKANVASPTFTGVPQAPTAASNNNSTQIATTAFVTDKLNTQETAITGAYQQYTTNAVVTYSNTVNQLLALKANLASPEFSGTPRSTTPTAGDNSSRIATTAFTTASVSTLQSTVNSAIAALQDLINSTRPVPAGAVFYMASTVVPYGYLECNGAWVLKTSYETLWQALGSPALGTGDNAGKFKLPDLRGEFIRGLDNGRAVDSNRSLNSSQAATGVRILIDQYAQGSGATTNGDFLWKYRYPMGTLAVTGSNVDGFVTPPTGDPSLMRYTTASTDPTAGTAASYNSYGSSEAWRAAGLSTSALGTVNVSDNNIYYTASVNENVGSGDNISFTVRPRNVALMPIIKW